MIASLASLRPRAPAPDSQAVLTGKDLKFSSLTEMSSVDEAQFVDQTKASKKAVALALRNPEKLEAMRNAAAAQGVRENVDFCVDCQAYKLLFSAEDRKPRAQVSGTRRMAARRMARAGVCKRASACVRYRLRALADGRRRAQAKWPCSVHAVHMRISMHLRRRCGSRTSCRAPTRQ